jgi:hypothetical protein
MGLDVDVNYYKSFLKYLVENEEMIKIMNRSFSKDDILKSLQTIIEEEQAMYTIDPMYNEYNDY